MRRNHFHVERVDNGWRLMVYHINSTGDSANTSSYVAETPEKLIELVNQWVAEE
jgi:hypothetical protein